MAKRRPQRLKGIPVPAQPPPPLTSSPTTRFERDLARMKKQGANMQRLKVIIEALCARQPMPPGIRGHALSGEWKGCRDCHIAPDWILIYERAENNLILYRTGTHSDLFES
jgi:mRNA interferase YafQ